MVCFNEMRDECALCKTHVHAYKGYQFLDFCCVCGVPYKQRISFPSEIFYRLATWSHGWHRKIGQLVPEPETLATTPITTMTSTARPPLATTTPRSGSLTTPLLCLFVDLSGCPSPPRVRLLACLCSWRLPEQRHPLHCDAPSLIAVRTWLVQFKLRISRHNKPVLYYP